MKNIVLIIFILAANTSFGQTEKPANKMAIESFVENYNSDNYEGVFSMFSPEMKRALPFDKTVEFLSGLKTREGKISNWQFSNYVNGSYASYKTEFERAVWSINISLDDQSKINGLFVKPFTEESPTKKAINGLLNNENTVSKNQSEILFENSNNFPNQTQIAIAIIENGDVKFYGIKRNNDTISSENNSKSIFEIGSITKVFTSTVLAGYVLSKKIKLDDNINDYLTFPLKDNIKLSFGELANHTSGLPSLPSNLDFTSHPENPYKDYDDIDLEDYLSKSLERDENLKRTHQYSNLGTGLLGYTLSQIAGISYENLSQSLIFSEFNMLNSTVNPNNVTEIFVRGLDEEGNEVSNWELSALVGAGGILSNVEDLSKFAIAQFNPSNKALELTRQKTFEINDTMDVGLGWHIIPSHSDNEWHWHNGGTGGYSSSMVIDVKNKNGIIILSNVSGFSSRMGNIDKLCFELMETLESK